jgi:hypothetical protein
MNASNCIFSNDFELKLLHYKFLSLDYVIDRYETLKNRQSEYNKIQKFNTHYSIENAQKRHEELRITSVTVVHE